VPLFRTGLQSSALPQGRRNPRLHSLLLVAPRQPGLQRAGTLLLALLEPGIPHTNRRSFLLANRRPSQATRGHGGGALLANATAGRALLGSVAHLLLVDQVRLGRSLSGLVQHRQSGQGHSFGLLGFLYFWTRSPDHKFDVSPLLFPRVRKNSPSPMPCRSISTGAAATRRTCSSYRWNSPHRPQRWLFRIPAGLFVAGRR